MNHVIETDELRRVFKSRVGDVEAVAGVNFAVEEGEIFRFLGPNGAARRFWRGSYRVGYIRFEPRTVDDAKMTVHPRSDVLELSSLAIKVG